MAKQRSLYYLEEEFSPGRADITIEDPRDSRTSWTDIPTHRDWSLKRK